MNRTSVEYVFKVLNREGFRFFKITDMAGASLYEQRDEDFSPQQCEDAIRDFLEYNKGVYNIQLRSKSPSRGNQGIVQKYTISNLETNREEIPVAGIDQAPPAQIFNGSAGGDALNQRDIFALYQGALDKINQLQQQMQTANLEALRRENDLNMKILTLETKAKNNKKDDSMNQIAIAGLSALLGGGQTPMINGIGETADDVDFGVSKQDDKRLENAIRILLSKDPNFVDNIEALARLAQNNPDMYQQGVKMIKQFG